MATIMKELSTEEKAKLYDEAIKRAKSLIGDTIIEESGQHIAEVIFPELRESEDERIRKRIIQALHGDVLDIEETNKAIAWLEKQVSVDEDEIVKGIRRGVAISLMNHIDANSKGMCLSNMECEDIENAIVNEDWNKVYGYMKKKLEKQGEQKSTDDLTQQEAMDIAVAKCFEQGDHNALTEFERTLADICIGWIGEEYGWKQYIKDNADVLLKIAIKKFNSVQDASFEQKSAIKLERDDNGEPVLTPFEAELFSMVSEAWQEYALGEEVNIAKIVKEHSIELLERANEQKSAWSEEDEITRKALINLVEMYYGGCFDKTEKNRLLNFLKSIRPQNHWKPSDEQMEALKGVQDGVFRLSILQSLYDDLLKLTK